MHSKKSKQKLSLNSSQNPPFTFEAIGTSWNIDLPLLSQDKKQPLLDKILKRINEFDNTYSRFQKHSLIYRMYQHPGTYPLPDDATPLLTFYSKLYHLSGGKFTPLIGTLLNQAGYDKDYSFIKKEITTLPRLEDVFSYTKNEMTLRDKHLLDFGAGGKGYIVDMISGLLESEGIKTYCIDASGDIVYKADSPLRVGLEHPENPDQVIGVTSILNQSICASATNRRKWKNFHHILDPHTLSSPHSVLATWVIAKTALIADALTTCLFLINPSLLEKEFSFEYLILFSDYTIQKSKNFHAELYYN